MGNQTQEQRAHKGRGWSLYNGGIETENSVPRRWKPLQSLLLMVSGGLLVLGGLSLFGMWRTGGQFFHNLRAAFTVADSPAKVDVRSMVVQQVRGASELTTAIYTMESVVPTSRERTIGGYVIGKTTLLYIAHGEVRAGVDLATLRPEDVQIAGTTATLRLPPPKILDSKIDVNRSKVYDYDRGFMGLGPDVAPELQELAQRETLGKIVEAACTDGVLQAANERAKLAVSQLLTTAGYTQFTVMTQPPTETCAASSLPSPTPLPPASPAPSVSVTPLPATPLPSPVPSPAASSVPSPDSLLAPSVIPNPPPSPAPTPVQPAL